METSTLKTVITTHQKSTTLARQVIIDPIHNPPNCDIDIVVNIPDCYKIAKGKVKPGDKYINRLKLPEVEWINVDIADIKRRMKEKGNGVVKYELDTDLYALIIRPVK